MQRLVDIRTGHIRDFGDDWPAPPGEPQIYDWFRLKVVGERPPAARPTTIWRDEDLGRVQRELAAKFPHRIVELLDWSDSRLRVLVRVTGGSDPGRVFLYQRTEDLVVEIFRHTPWLAAAQLHPTRWFAAAAPDGTPSGAYLTSPRPSRTQPPPLLVLLPLESPSRALPAFDPEAQVFAELGFAVARVHHRAAVSLLAADLSAWRTSLDRLAVDAAQPVLFLTAPGLSLAAEATPAELRRHLGRPVELVARDATFAATSPTTRATAYRQLGEHLQQRLNSFTSPTKPAEEVK